MNVTNNIFSYFYLIYLSYFLIYYIYILQNINIVVAKKYWWKKNKINKKLVPSVRNQ